MKTTTTGSQRNQETRKLLRPLALVFILINALLIVFRNRLQDKGVDAGVVIMGNLLLFIVSALSVLIYRRGSHKKGHAAVRNIYGGFMLKFFTLIVAAMVYFFFAKEINKPAVFICLGLYLVYSLLGVSQSVRKETVSK